PNSRRQRRIRGRDDRRDPGERVPDALLERSARTRQGNREAGLAGFVSEIRVQLTLQPAVKRGLARFQARLETPLDDLQLRLEHWPISEFQECEAADRHTGDHRSQWPPDPRRPDHTFFRSAMARTAQPTEQGNTPQPSLRPR